MTAVLPLSACGEAFDPFDDLAFAGAVSERPAPFTASGFSPLALARRSQLADEYGFFGFGDYPRESADWSLLVALIIPRRQVMTAVTFDDGDA